MGFSLSRKLYGSFQCIIDQRFWLKKFKYKSKYVQQLIGINIKSCCSNCVHYPDWERKDDPHLEYAAVW